VDDSKKNAIEIPEYVNMGRTNSDRVKDEIEDPCCGCGAESEVGCGINPHRYYCEPCWTLYKRGKLVTEIVQEHTDRKEAALAEDKKEPLSQLEEVFLEPDEDSLNRIDAITLGPDFKPSGYEKINVRSGQAIQPVEVEVFNREEDDYGNN